MSRIKKNTKVHVLETVVASKEDSILSDQLITLDTQNYLTSRFRLVTIRDKKGKVLQFIINRFNCSSVEITEMDKAHWKINLFFKHIKQHMTIKKFFSRSKQRFVNQTTFSLSPV